MLTHLQVRNLAIVDEVEVEPGRGMTAMTGETGAGKSILVDALGLVLGDRADTLTAIVFLLRPLIIRGKIVHHPEELARD